MPVPFVPKKAMLVYSATSGQVRNCTAWNFLMAGPCPWSVRKMDCLWKDVQRGVVRALPQTERLLQKPPVGPQVDLGKLFSKCKEC